MAIGEAGAATSGCRPSKGKRGGVRYSRPPRWYGQQAPPTTVTWPERPLRDGSLAVRVLLAAQEAQVGLDVVGRVRVLLAAQEAQVGLDVVGRVRVLLA